MQVKVCTGKSCASKFSKYITTRLENDTKFYDWKNVELEECLCLWECKKWPNIKIDKETFNYVNPAKASDIILKKLSEKKKNNSPKKKK